MNKEIVERLKAEGALVRNTGANSIKSVKELLIENNSAIVSTLGNIYDIVISQNSILLESLEVQKKIAETLNDSLRFDQETERDRRRDERLDEQTDEEEKVSPLQRIKNTFGFVTDTVKKSIGLIGKTILGLYGGAFIFGFVKEAIEDFFGIDFIESFNNIREVFDKDFREQRKAERSIEEVKGALESPDFGKPDGADPVALGKELTIIEETIRAQPESFSADTIAEVNALRATLAPILESLGRTAETRADVAAADAAGTNIKDVTDTGKTIEESVTSALNALRIARAAGDKEGTENAVERLVISKIIEQSEGANVVAGLIAKAESVGQQSMFKNKNIEPILRQVLGGEGVGEMFRGEEEFERLKNEIYDRLEDVLTTEPSTPSVPPDVTSSLNLGDNNFAVNLPEAPDVEFSTPSLATQTEMIASTDTSGGFAYMGGNTYVTKAGDSVLTNSRTMIYNISASDKTDTSEFVSMV